MSDTTREAQIRVEGAGDRRPAAEADAASADVFGPVADDCRCHALGVRSGESAAADLSTLVEGDAARQPVKVTRARLT